MEEKNKNQHPLDNMGYIENWSKWKELWEKDKTAEERAGLLHIGLDVRTGSMEEMIESIIFYLTVADGYYDYTNFGDFEQQLSRLYTGFGDLEDKRRLKQKVAEKAFNILSLKFFKPCIDAYKDVHTKNPEDKRWQLVMGPLASEFISFFKKRDRTGRRSMNIPHINNEEIKYIHEKTARNFAIKFCEFGLSFDHFGQYYEEEYDGPIRKKLEELRPDFVEILVLIGETEILLQPKFLETMRDHRCNNRIMDLIMEEKYRFLSPETGEDSFRHPNDLIEAVYVNSKSAKTLYIFQTVVDPTYKRNDEIISAIATRKEADKIIKKYTT